MDAWRHHLASSREVGIEAALRYPFADDVAVGHHADQPVILSNRNRADIVFAHQFCELGDRNVRTDPIDALVHRVFDLHSGPPLRSSPPFVEVYNGSALVARYPGERHSLSVKNQRGTKSAWRDPIT